MVPDLIWTPRNLVPEKFGPCIKCCKMIFMLEPNFLGTKFLGDQISWAQISWAQIS